ncbi:MAG: tetratricopeptide repeat protein [Acidobacteria bacterium]|nr:tetratricopeptide repeat protein [Acidobacteriota bacterium]
MRYRVLRHTNAAGKSFANTARSFGAGAARALFVAAVLVAATFAARAQSGATRPRRVPPSTVGNDAQTRPTPAPRETPLLDTTPARNVPARTAPASGASAPQGDTARAAELYNQNQFAAARDEAKRIAAADPNNSAAWRLAGFAGVQLKQYAAAAADLQRAHELRLAAKEDDPELADKLAETLVLAEQFDKALPLLVAATTRAGAKPDAVKFYYRGLAEYRTNKPAEAERSFNEAVKLDPKSAISLFYLGRISYERGQPDAAVAALNRATAADPKLAQGWTLLTLAYLSRAGQAGATPKADADYLNAVRTSDALIRLRADESAVVLNGQALIGAKQYARAAAVLERAAAAPTAQGSTLYLLGVAHSRAKSFPKAVAALERAASKSPDDVNVYRELGYALEVSKQYAKALAAYERGAELAPDDADFKQSAERVRPFAK